MKSIAVIGSSGQLGSDIVSVFAKSKWQVLPVNRDNLTVEDDSQVHKYFSENKVDVIVNTAALHQVGICENEVSRSWAVNAQGSSNIAAAAKAQGAKYVYISTDYVFDGKKSVPYSESDQVSPINVYGASKAAGEFVALTHSPNNIVARISSVFGLAGSSGKGGNFVETILNKAKKGEDLRVVDDMFMAPSYTRDIANKLLNVLDQNLSGIFHLSNLGRASWYEFAAEICKQVGLEVQIEKTKTDVDSLPRRPIDSSLSTDKLISLGIHQRSWQDALNAYLIEKGHIS